MVKEPWQGLIYLFVKLIVDRWCHVCFCYYTDDVIFVNMFLDRLCHVCFLLLHRSCDNCHVCEYVFRQMMSVCQSKFVALQGTTHGSSFHRAVEDMRHASWQRLRKPMLDRRKTTNKGNWYVYTFCNSLCYILPGYG